MLDLTNMTLEELKATQEEIIQIQNELLKNKKRAQKLKAEEFNKFLIANRNVVIQLVKHIEGCDYENGFLSDDKDRYCSACHLKEILDGEWLLNAFNVNFTIDIKELEDEYEN